MIITLKNGTILEHEPVIHPGCRLSASDDSLAEYVGAINTRSTEQLIEKFREQAIVVGFSKKRQDEIIDFILNLEKQPSIKPLIDMLVL